VALVEFALVAPLLLVLLFGMLDFGRAFNYWIDTTHLANEGARWTVVNSVPSASGTLQTYLRSRADTDELRNGGSSAVPDPLGSVWPSSTPTARQVGAEPSETRSRSRPE